MFKSAVKTTCRSAKTRSRNIWIMPIILILSCGIDSFESISQHVGVSLKYDDLPDISEYVVDGRKWPVNTIKYCFTNGTYDIDDPIARQAIRDAMML